MIVNLQKITLRDMTHFKQVREECHRHEKAGEELPYSVRPAVITDVVAMQSLFRDTVLQICRRDYTAEEVADWVSCGDSLEHWKALLSAHRYIVAQDRQGNIIGFSSMNAAGYLHAMFVHKDWQRKGIAALLLSEVEKMAHGYGVDRISVEASITARAFFEKHGYTVMREQKAKANRLYMTNFVMMKIL